MKNATDAADDMRRPSSESTTAASEAHHQGAARHRRRRRSREVAPLRTHHDTWRHASVPTLRRHGRPDLRPRCRRPLPRGSTARDLQRARDHQRVRRPSTSSLEVAQHLGERRCRCVAMASTDGCAAAWTPSTPARRSPCRSGERTKGRIFNLLGEPVDDGGPRRQERDRVADPPRSAPLRRAGGHLRGLRDGHQGRRPARPVRQGRQDRPVRRRRRRQDRAHQELIHNIAQRARRLLRVLRRGRAHPRGQRPLARDDERVKLRRRAA